MKVILPYNRASRSARMIRRALGLRWMNEVGRPTRDTDVILCWGRGSYPHRGVAGRWINEPGRVVSAIDKLSAFSAMEAAGVTVPKWTTEHEIAQSWAESGATVLARTLVRGHSGRGIVVVPPHQQVPLARFYTRYRPKAAEYRVAVCGGEVIDIQEKRRRHGSPVTTHVRSHAGGWVFCRSAPGGGPIECPPSVVAAAVAAVRSLGLDFGAADIGHTRSNDTATVYEVNTSPGIDGSTINVWRDALARMIHDATQA